MLFKSFLATCCVALLPALIGAGPVVIDATPVDTPASPPGTVSTPVDTSIHGHSTSHANPLHYSVGYVSVDTKQLYNYMDVAPEPIDASAYTHIIVTYAWVTRNFHREDFYYPEILYEDDSVYIQELISNVKNNYPDVKVIISFADSSFNFDNDMPSMVAKEQSRRRFIELASHLLQSYNLDGINFDWQLPSSEDCVGYPSVTENYVRLVKEMREQFKQQYSISIGIPFADSYYAKGLNVELMAPHLDFITIMTFPIHGPTNSGKGIGMPPLAAMQDVKNGLNLLLSNKNIPKSKLLLGLSFSGNMYKTTHLGRNAIGDPHSDPLQEEPIAGPCLQWVGYLTFKEVTLMKAYYYIRKPHIRAEYDDESSFSKVMALSEDRLLIYNDPGTTWKHKEFAMELGLGGISAVFIDQDDSEGSMSKAIKNQFSRYQLI